MGLNFRKSINFGPLRINLSKSGVGFSLGVKGFRVSRSAKGKHKATISLPGTGLSYTQSLDNLPGDLSDLKDKATSLIQNVTGSAGEEETEKTTAKAKSSSSSAKKTTKASGSTTKKTASGSAAKKTTKSTSGKTTKAKTDSKA